MSQIKHSFTIIRMQTELILLTKNAHTKRTFIFLQKSQFFNIINVSKSLLYAIASRSIMLSLKLTRKSYDFVNFF